jgi:protein FAM50
MGLQGYVGSAADQARIRQLEKEREEDRKLIEAAKQKLAADQTGFRSWKRGEVEVVEQALKKETIGLVTRDQYVEKKSTIQARLEVQSCSACHRIHPLHTTTCTGYSFSFFLTTR